MSYQGSLLNVMYVHSKPYGSSGGSLMVYCPAIMPQIGMGNPKTTAASLNKSAFVNDVKCKPSISSKITTQNYMTVKVPFVPYKDPCYYFGSGMKIISDTGDVLSGRLSSENEDNSTLWP